MRALGLAPLLLAACAHTEPSETRALHELERLAFVPPAPCVLAAGSFPFSIPFSDQSLLRAIVIDRFEFTRADLEYYWSAHAREADAITWLDEAARAAPDRAEWPAFMDFNEAEELARLRGMRLPTPGEWLHVAVGPHPYSAPWGETGWFANSWSFKDGVDYSLNTPCNVGTYENGKSKPYGCYDLLGNVWEWVDGIVPGYEPAERYVIDPELEGWSGTYVSILGGSYDSPPRSTYQLDWTRGDLPLRFHARKEDKRTLSPAIGVRMCADAEGYLWASAPHWGADESAHRRVRAVGRVWRGISDVSFEALRNLLADLRARPGAPPALAWLEEGVLDKP